MLSSLRDKAMKEGVPIVREQTGQLLEDLVKSSCPQKILEIGSGVGYSAILMKKAFDGAQVLTIEKDSERAEEARKNYNAFDVEIKQIEGDAGEELKRLETSGEKFDFVFLDGPKGQYIKYLPHIKNMLRKNGILFADNVLYHGLVEGESFVKHKHRTIVMNLRKFIEVMQSDPHFETKLLNIEDGVLIAKLIS